MIERNSNFRLLTQGEREHTEDWIADIKALHKRLPL